MKEAFYLILLVSIFFGYMLYFISSIKSVYKYWFINKYNGISYKDIAFTVLLSLLLYFMILHHTYFLK
jgi:hypothetical protein